MKTLILVMSLIALGLMGVGCSKNSSNSANNTTGFTASVSAPVVIDPGVGGSTGLPTFSGGSTSTFVPASKSVFEDYVALHPLNNPTDFKININLAQSVSARYGGKITISYVDNGVQYKGEFTAGMGTNAVGLRDNGRPQADYNYWFNFENKLVFTGFFQDAVGAVTLTLTPESTTTGGGNDGEPIASATYKGEISYKNFRPAVEPQSSIRACWFITNSGPYDCRSNIIQTKCGLAPGSEAGYKVLGTFTGVKIKTAFNISSN